MKVSTLIKKLEKLDPKKQVVIQKDEDGWHKLEEVSFMKKDDDFKGGVVSLNWID